jgi:hypothetical protein
MSDNFDLNNLYLDDNNFIALPDGDYHFRVEDLELDYSKSEKMPPNTRVLKYTLTIPFKNADGQLDETTVRHNLNVYQPALFAIRQFMECVGAMPEKGRVKMPDPKSVIGKTGICSIRVAISNKGNEYNQVDTCYPPSKAPTITANDDAFNMSVGKAEDNFREMKEEEAEANPFV